MEKDKERKIEKDEEKRGKGRRKETDWKGKRGQTEDQKRGDRQRGENEGETGGEMQKIS
jgi:hypothetical protein